MRRRDFMSLLGGAAAAPLWPFSARAESAPKEYLIAHLASASEAASRPRVAAFLAGLRELGYVEGQTFRMVSRHANGQFAKLPALASELVGLTPDVLFVETTPGALAAKRATRTVPIVFVAVADPIGVGLVASLAKPGGNITGLTNIVAELAGKRLEILHEIIPTAKRIAVLINPDDQNASLQMRSAEAVADKLGLMLQPVAAVRSAADLQPAFEASAAAGAQAALRMTDPLVTALSKQTAEMEVKYRIPVIYPFHESVQQGGLVAYGTDLLEQFRAAASYVHKILHGANPAELPVERPTKFHLAINLRTANTLGVTIAPMLLARADEVIE
ncbi:MAG TPA: ABC transporter substrate-binding protein [Xanthobacteraceae bacterium]|nr:ABC transporter substrate-binding protein [Xanthobacteraceae bacterium]